MEELFIHGKAPDDYLDYELTDEPWIVFRKLHSLDEVLLLVYFKVDKKKIIRLTTITNHLELRRGTFR
ncbi:MAG TPA: hypothetical protein H9829_06545 [Candidatus Tetragenococcus pullicola]|nr:hypothetical protein [Candidatus Tetragenococcus pullicola]